MLLSMKGKLTIRKSKSSLPIIRPEGVIAIGGNKAFSSGGSIQQ